MKTAIKLLLLYIGFQALAAVLVMVPMTVHHIIKYGDANGLDGIALVPTMLLAFIIMGLYLWKAGYISTDRRSWSPVSGSYLFYSLIICLTFIVIADFAMSLLPPIPDVMEPAFEQMRSSQLGVLCLAMLGPVLEELMFRGAITRALLKQYDPNKAIILSALIFGIAHMNPVQVIFAFFMGLILAWIYYKTASLIPCILIHFLNNGLSVFLSLKYPEVETTQELFAGDTYYIVVGAAIVLFIGVFLLMNKTTIPFPWKENRPEVIEHNN